MAQKLIDRTEHSLMKLILLNLLIATCFCLNAQTLLKGKIRFQDPSYDFMFKLEALNDYQAVCYYDGKREFVIDLTKTDTTVTTTENHELITLKFYGKSEKNIDHVITYVWPGKIITPPENSQNKLRPRLFVENWAGFHNKMEYVIWQPELLWNGVVEEHASYDRK